MYAKSKLMLLAMLAAPVFAADLSRFSNADMVTGLKDALTQGANAAVAKLGTTDGFFKNPKVKIPLPENLKKVEKAMRFAGMGKQADELVVTMNRAAEAAVPEAQSLLVDAVKKMSVTDAKNILTGPDDAATKYFRKSTQTQLTEKFLPIVKEATDKVGLAQQYNDFAATGAQFGLVKKEDAKIENYVTTKALDGLYLMIAEQERSLRQNPVEATTSIAKKIFGAIKG
ncbi:MAG TPA: DUF4197 domain-containing protein [Burkholderiales bacterium]|nr:DUF4197 domain-containing protein [Burkholderiales bacterium]